MDVLKAFSNQIGSIHQLNSTSAQNKTANNSVNENTQSLLSHQLKPILDEGVVIYNPNNPYQEFLYRLEDALNSYLLDIQQDSSLLRLQTFIKQFEAECFTEFNSNDIVYARSFVGTVRVLIRHVSENPMKLVQIISKFGELNAIKKDKLKSFETNSLSMQTIITPQSDVAFLPFDDEPYCNVIHLAKFMWRQIKSRYQSIAIKISKCGCQFLEESIFVPFIGNNGEVEDPTYLNSQGYSICRYKCRIDSPYDSCRELELPSTANAQESIYIWYILHLKLHNVFYYCPTSEPLGNILMTSY